MIQDALERIFDSYQPDGVIHLAAESHVDRSILSPLDFVYTNVIGTVNLLNAAKHFWKDNYEGKRFYHVSTDEVYGALVIQVSLPKKQRMIRIHLIVLPKHPAIIL